MPLLRPEDVEIGFYAACALGNEIEDTNVQHKLIELFAYVNTTWTDPDHAKYKRARCITCKVQFIVINVLCSDMIFTMYIQI